MNTALFSGSDLDVVFSLVLTMSLSASWIAAAVLVLRLCLKRAPKWVNVLLWGIVAVRLMLPFSIESPLSLLPRTEAILPAAAAQPIQTGTAPAVGGAAAAASGAAMRSQPGRTTILAWVWLAGIAVLLLYTWISTQRLRRKVREAVRLRGNIYETEHIASPFVLGVLRPRIYLPYHMDSVEGGAVSELFLRSAHGTVQGSGFFIRNNEDKAGYGGVVAGADIRALVQPLCDMNSLPAESNSIRKHKVSRGIGKGFAGSELEVCAESRIIV